MKRLLLVTTLLASSCSVAKNEIGEAVGYAELAGLRYPITQYSKWVVDGKLMRGSRIDRVQGYQFLAGKGFSTIVDLRMEGPGDEGYGAKAAGLNPVRIEILDNTAPTRDQVNQFLTAVSTAKGSVYFHCEAGVGRTGIMAAAYRVKVQNWTPERALAEAKTFGIAIPAQEKFILNLRNL